MNGKNGLQFGTGQDLEEPVPPNGTVAHLVFLGGSYWGVGEGTGPAP